MHFAVGRKEAMSSAVDALLASESLKIDELNTNGATALHLCALWGHRDIARQLIDAGANPTLQTKKGITPLQVSILFLIDSWFFD